jgi:glycosyltransferase involved in cell wall biosynthesis
LKTKLLYIGNKLSKHGFTPTCIDILGPQLESNYDVVYASDYENQIIRIGHMFLKTMFFNGGNSYILIDTYSTVSFYYVVIVSMLARLKGIPYIPILHGGNLENRLRNHPRLSRMVFANAHKLVAPSGYMYAIFKNYAYDNILLIPNNIDITIYPFTPRISIKPKILWVRSFASLYNPELGIKAVAELNKVFPQIELCFVGPEKDGTMENCQQLVAELNLSKQISFKGKLNKEDWIQLSMNYDIFLSTTNVDNTPVSVMEAMALGMVVVSTNAGGVPFLIEHAKTGYLYNIGDEQGLVVLLRELMNGDLLSTSESARNKAEEWDWKNIKEEWRKLLGA